MKHSDTRTLYEYWNVVRLSRPAPLRSELCPRAMKSLLPRLFILQRDATAGYTFRLAGTELCRWFGCELRGADFLDNWRRNDRLGVAALLRNVVDNMAPAVVGVTGRDHEDQACAMELVLLPVRVDGTDDVRVLGCAGILATPPWIGRHAIVAKELASLRLLWPQNTPRFLEPDCGATADGASQDVFDRVCGQRRGHLRVIDGGVA